MRPLLLLLLVTAQLTCACERAADTRAALRDAVFAALERGDQGQALDAIRKLRESTPDGADADLEIATLWVRAGEAPRAAWLLEESVRRHPQRPDLRIALARVSLLLNNPAQALEVLHAIGAASGHHATALLVRAEAEQQLGDLEAGLATLAEVEALYPERHDARLARIVTLLREQRYDEARALIEETRDQLARGSESSDESREVVAGLELTLAQLQARSGETGMAESSLRKLVQADPADPRAWQALVEVMAEAGRGGEALELLRSTLEGSEAPSSLHVMVARMQARLGRDDEATASLREFVAENDGPWAYLPLVEFHSIRREPDEAASVLDEATRRFPGEPALHLLHTEALLETGRIEAARRAARRFAETSFEGDPQVEYLEARLVLAEGDAEDAARRLRILAPRLDLPATQYWLGRALQASGDVEGAQLRYGSAQRRNPRWPAPQVALLALAQQRNDWPAVASHAQRLVGLAPRRTEAWIALVDALVALGRVEAAETSAREFLEQHPDRPEARVSLARALAAQDRLEEALQQLDRAADESPSPGLVAERARMLGAAGRLEDGIAVASRGLEAEPASAELQTALAALHFGTGAARAGSEAVDRALALDPDDPRPLRLRCQFRAARGDWVSAEPDCATYLESRPLDAEAHFMLGAVQQGLGDIPAAIASYREAARLDERDMRPRNNLAELLAATGDLDGALEAAQQAYRLEPASPFVQDTLAMLYLRRGLVERAIALLEAAVSAGAPQQEIRLHLALAYRDAGRLGEARALVDQLGEEDLPDALRGELERAVVSLSRADP